MDDSCGEWVEGMGFASWCCEHEVGVASGCGCKEVYRFPHTTYPYSCICSFLQQHPYFLFIFLCFSFLYICVFPPGLWRIYMHEPEGTKRPEGLSAYTYAP